MGMIRLLRRLLILGIVTLGATMIAVLFATYWAMDRFSSNRQLDQKFDVVVVLAAGIEPDGLLSYPSRRRIRTAVWLQQNDVAGRLIFSGGPIAKNVNLSQFMMDFALEIGAPQDLIELEDQSRTTWENLRFTYPMLDRPEYERIGVLTDPSHLPRTLVLNAYFGGPEMIPLASFGQFKNSRAQRVYEIGREAMAWWYNLGKIAVWEISGWLGFSDEQRGKYIF